MPIKFSRNDLKLSDVLSDIQQGQIGLPDLQRPFVWKDDQVKELLHSMYLGYPIGTLLLWDTESAKTKQIGGAKPQAGEENNPNRLIIDGQQRMTSLMATFLGTEVVGAELQKRKIRIAFNPLSDPDPEKSICPFSTNPKDNKDDKWLPDVAEYLSKDSPMPTLMAYFAKNKNLTEEQSALAQKSFNQLFELRGYPLSCIIINKSTSEEEVADIFVKINSSGTKLDQSDFMMTVLSVYSPETRRVIEEFALRASRPHDETYAYSPLYQPKATELLGIAASLAFQKASRKEICKKLRGRNKQGAVEIESRVKNLATLNEKVLGTKTFPGVVSEKAWIAFSNAIIAAGFCHKDLIVSSAALLSCYNLYLRGLELIASDSDAKNPKKRELDLMVGRWMWFCTIDARFGAHTDSVTEDDVKLGASVESFEGLKAALNHKIDTTLNDDWWSSAAITRLKEEPKIARVSLTAALVQQGASTLFSDKKISDLLLVAPGQAIMPLEWHHIFPQNFLEGLGVNKKSSDIPENIALIETWVNREISDRDPKDYGRDFHEKSEKNGDGKWGKWCESYGLHPVWYKLSFEEFKADRFNRIPAILRKSIDSLK